ncbi:MAG: hypothetical protein CMJ58_10910 [Planctomycetaceae bacterium]|nr:hypothetical protein [Planctomycetaceae bacterium]
MFDPAAGDLTSAIGAIPYRMALAGGWIDQPFVSRLNPRAPGAMVVVGLQPVQWFMERAGMATGTRKVARQLWPDGLPGGDRAALVRQLYDAENAGKDAPSGSQDMIGLIYPGINRLDYDAAHEGGIYPVHIESHNDPATAAWLEQVLWIVPVAPRPPGYDPLGEQHLDPQWIERLGQSGHACFDAIVSRDAPALGASLTECTACWDALLPHVLRHPTLEVDLPALIHHYQSISHGAMYSGCGGGYVYVVSDQPVPGAFKPVIRISGEQA